MPTNRPNRKLSTDYRIRHARTWARAATSNNHFTRALRLMFEGWQLYAMANRNQYGSAIGDDYVLGEYWEEIGYSLLGLLNGETGPGIDCGSLETLFRETLRVNACNQNR